MENTNLPAKTTSMDDLSKLLLTKQAIPFIQLLTYNSTVLADNPELKPGSFYLSKGEINFGPEMEAIPLDARSYAYVRKGGGLLFDTFDPTSNHFKEAIRLGKAKKKGYQAKWGGMVLLYIPSHNIFATYFLAGAGGGRRCLEQVLPHMGKNILFSSKACKSNAGFNWFAPLALISGDEKPQLPEETMEMVSLFYERQGREAEEEDNR